MQTKFISTSITCSAEILAIPARCSKPRRFENTFTVKVNIPDLSKKEAPVAFRWKELCLRGKKPKSKKFERRFYNGNLYSPAYIPQVGPLVPIKAKANFLEKARGNKVQITKTNPLLATSRIVTDETPKVTLKTKRQFEKSYIVVDGYLWVKCEEPRYYVLTMGMGNNHGGTHLSITQHHNSNIPRHNYFRADQFAEANAYLKVKAASRGDTKNVTTINKAERIQVLIPSAIKLKSNKNEN
jgi:hypothetical protein